MDTVRGFRIEVPDVFVPWGVSEPDLCRLLDDYGLLHAYTGAYTISCVLLGGLARRLEFRFFPPSDGTLRTLRIIGLSEDVEASFDELQKHFEAAFGKPTKEQRGTERKFPSFEWRLNGVYIQHQLEDRYDLTEYAGIEKSRDV